MQTQFFNGFYGLQTRVPGFDCQFGGRPVQYSAVVSHLSEAGSRVVEYKLRCGWRLDGSWKLVKTTQHELYEHMTLCKLHKNCYCPFSFMFNVHCSKMSPAKPAL